MFCDQSGAEREVNQGFCSRCGKEVKGAISFAAPRRGRAGAQIRLLGILWLALSAFEAVGGVVAIILANSLFSPWGPHGMPLFLHPLIAGVGILSIIKAAGGFLTGWGLLNRQRGAGMLGIILGGVSPFFHIPFGPVLGIYTRWGLLRSRAEEE